MKDVPEFFEVELGESLISRTETLGEPSTSLDLTTRTWICTCMAIDERAGGWLLPCFGLGGRSNVALRIAYPAPPRLASAQPSSGEHDNAPITRLTHATASILQAHSVNSDLLICVM